MRITSQVYDKYEDAIRSGSALDEDMGMKGVIGEESEDEDEDEHKAGGK